MGMPAVELATTGASQQGDYQILENQLEWTP